MWESKSFMFGKRQFMWGSPCVSVMTQQTINILIHILDLNVGNQLWRPEKDVKSSANSSGISGWRDAERLTAWTSCVWLRRDGFITDAPEEKDFFFTVQSCRNNDVSIPLKSDTENVKQACSRYLVFIFISYLQKYILKINKYMK